MGGHLRSEINFRWHKLDTWSTYSVYADYHLPWEVPDFVAYEIFAKNRQPLADHVRREMEQLETIAERRERVLDELGKHCSFVKLLGSYPDKEA